MQVAFPPEWFVHIICPLFIIVPFTTTVPLFVNLALSGIVNVVPSGIIKVFSDETVSSPITVALPITLPLLPLKRTLSLIES